jgi:hypothetical protein
LSSRSAGTPGQRRRRRARAPRPTGSAEAECSRPPGTAARGTMRGRPPRRRRRPSRRRGTVCGLLPWDSCYSRRRGTLPAACPSSTRIPTSMSERSPDLRGNPEPCPRRRVRSDSSTWGRIRATRRCFELAEAEPDIFPTCGAPSERRRDDHRSRLGRRGSVRPPPALRHRYRRNRSRPGPAAATPATSKKPHSAVNSRGRRNYDLPVVIHCRDAHDDTYDLLESLGRPIRASCTASARPGTPTAPSHSDSISPDAGPVSYKKNDALRASLHRVPHDRLLVETDCPFLPPEGFRENATSRPT